MPSIWRQNAPFLFALPLLLPLASLIQPFITEHPSKGCRVVIEMGSESDFPAGQPGAGKNGGNQASAVYKE
jgi:hypothetical protein